MAQANRSNTTALSRKSKPAIKDRFEIAILNTVDDPVFLRIRALQTATKAYEAIGDKQAAMEEKFGHLSPEVSGQPAPVTFMHWAFYSLEEIELFLEQRFLPGFAKQTLGPKAGLAVQGFRDQLGRKIMRHWKRAQVARKALQEKCGWAGLERAGEKAGNARDAALKALCETVPVTPEGFAAWFKELKPFVEPGLQGLYSSGATDGLWDTLQRSARRQVATAA